MNPHVSHILLSAPRPWAVAFYCKCTSGCKSPFWCVFCCPNLSLQLNVYTIWEENYWKDVFLAYVRHMILKKSPQYSCCNCVFNHLFVANTCVVYVNVKRYGASGYSSAKSTGWAFWPIYSCWVCKYPCFLIMTCAIIAFYSLRVPPLLFIHDVCICFHKHTLLH